MLTNWLIFLLGGLFSGSLAGLLGIGGGTVLVPLLIAINNNQPLYQPVNAVATSLLAIVITSLSGSIQNWRMGYLDLKRVIYIAIPSLFTAQIGAILAELVPSYILLVSFAFLLIGTIFLTNLRKRLASRNDLDWGPRQVADSAKRANPILSYLIIGGSGGLLAGFFGVGGGVVMVPLQMLLIKENIKKAVQTSLGIIVITSIAACVGHALQGNVKFLQGFLLGIGGLIGAQISTRFLPKLSDKLVTFLFRTLLAILSVYFFWKAWIEFTFNG